MLTILDSLPEEILETSAEGLHEVLPGPSLIHLSGRREDPLFVSVLLHGNEVTGWQTMQQVLKRYHDKALPRSLSLFIGNVAAAQQGQRCLTSQPDYNRIWRGEGDGPEAVMVRQVMEEMQQRRPFACVDIHNNTGRNPHYACINRVSRDFISLASLFSRTVVYFIKPDSVLSMAFAELCPAVTIECGRPGEAYGVEHAVEFIDACLHLSDYPAHDVSAHDIDLFHTVAVVKVPPHLSIGVEGELADLCLLPNVDHLNFRELMPGTALGVLREGAINGNLVVTNEAGEDVGERYFDVEESVIRTRTAVMPSMLTMDTDIIRQDCLCYLMERMALQPSP